VEDTGGGGFRIVAPTSFRALLHPTTTTTPQTQAIAKLMKAQEAAL